MRALRSALSRLGAYLPWSLRVATSLQVRDERLSMDTTTTRRDANGAQLARLDSTLDRATTDAEEHGDVEDRVPLSPARDPVEK